jgi:hypothetical protein
MCSDTQRLYMKSCVSRRILETSARRLPKTGCLPRLCVLARASLSMGRTRPKTRKARPPATELTETQRENKSEPTIEALLEKAQELIVQCDYNLAGKFVGRVLQRAPDHVEGKEMLGVVQLETGLLDAAKQVRTRSCTNALSMCSASLIRRSYHCCHRIQARPPHHRLPHISTSPS